MKYAKNLLGKGCTAHTPPAFTSSIAHSFFSEVCQSIPRQFSSRSWVPSAPLPTPDCAIEMAPISEEELARVIRKSKPSSALSGPWTGSPYIPSLRPALLDLFNRVIMEGSALRRRGRWLPSSSSLTVLHTIVSWQLSADCAHSCGEQVVFRDSEGPLRHIRAMASWIRTCRRLSSLQLSGWWSTSTCHQISPAAETLPLDIVNAYGSIHHSHQVHPVTLPRSSIVLPAIAVMCTPAFLVPSQQMRSLKVGVYQGDLLSVVIFLTVMNTLLDTLCSRKDLGFTLPRSSTTPSLC